MTWFNWGTKIETIPLNCDVWSGNEIQLSNYKSNEFFLYCFESWIEDIDPYRPKMYFVTWSKPIKPSPRLRHQICNIYAIFLFKSNFVDRFFVDKNVSIMGKQSQLFLWFFFFVCAYIHELMYCLIKLHVFLFIYIYIYPSNYSLCFVCLDVFIKRNLFNMHIHTNVKLSVLTMHLLLRATDAMLVGREQRQGVIYFPCNSI